MIFYIVAHEKRSNDNYDQISSFYNFEFGVSQDHFSQMI